MNRILVTFYTNLISSQCNDYIMKCFGFCEINKFMTTFSVFEMVKSMYKLPFSLFFYLRRKNFAYSITLVIISWCCCCDFFFFKSILLRPIHSNKWRVYLLDSETHEKKNPNVINEFYWYCIISCFWTALSIVLFHVLTSSHCYWCSLSHWIVLSFSLATQFSLDWSK